MTYNKFRDRMGWILYRWLSRAVVWAWRGDDVLMHGRRWRGSQWRGLGSEVQAMFRKGAPGIVVVVRSPGPAWEPHDTGHYRVYAGQYAGASCDERAERVNS